MINDTCLGKFYKEGITNAVNTKRDGVKYGYQFWVYNVNGIPTLTMTGHGGFFNIINSKKNTIISIFSLMKNISMAIFLAKVWFLKLRKK